MRLQITFRDFASSEAIEESVRDEAAMLQRLSDRLVACHVALSAPRGGTYYRIQIDVELPGESIAVTKESGHGMAPETFYSMLHEAFRAARERVSHHLELTREPRRETRV